MQFIVEHEDYSHMKYGRKCVLVRWGNTSADSDAKIRKKVIATVFVGCIHRGAAKSLARSGREQATATKP